MMSGKLIGYQHPPIGLRQAVGGLWQLVVWFWSVVRMSMDMQSPSNEANVIAGSSGPVHGLHHKG